MGDRMHELPHTRKCQECRRVFDMLDVSDSDEWYFGHDCEPEVCAGCGAESGERCRWGCLAHVKDAGGKPVSL